MPLAQALNSPPLPSGLKPLSRSTVEAMSPKVFPEGGDVILGLGGSKGARRALFLTLLLFKALTSAGSAEASTQFCFALFFLFRGIIARPRDEFILFNKGIFK